MMKLGRYVVSFPVYRLSSDVTYRAVRMPTVFERMVLRLVARYQDVSDVAALSMAAIFQERLGVQDTPALVTACLQHLKTLGVLDWSDNDAPLELALDRFRLTPLGQDFQQRDRLPVNPRTVTVAHFYFPLDAAVQPADDKAVYRLRLSEEPQAIRLGEEVLQPAGDTAAALVRQGLDGESHAWKSRNVEIGEVLSRVEQVYWETHVLELSCDSAGVLTVTAPSSPKLKQWLAHARPESVWEHLLSPILTPDADARLVTLPDLSLGGAIRIQPAGATARQADNGEREPPVLLRVVPEDEDAVQTIPAPVLWLAGNVAATRLPDHGSALRIKVSTPVELPDAFAGASLSKPERRPSVELAGTLGLFWAGQRRHCALRLTLGSEKSREIWTRIAPDIEAALWDETEPVMQALPVLWQSPEHLVETWRLRQEDKDPAEILAAADIFESALSSVAPVLRPQWEPVWRDGVAAQLEAAVSHLSASQPPARILNLLTAVRKRLAAPAAARLQTALLACAAPPESIDELLALRSALLPAAVFPPALLGDRVLHEGIAKAMNGDDAPWGEIPGAGPVLAGLRDAVVSVRHEIGEVALSAATEGRIEWRGLTPRSLDSVRRWREAVKALAAYRPQSAFARADVVQSFDRRVDAWDRLVQQRLAPPCEPTRRLVVIDTSALMKRPNLLEDMPSRDVPVLPRKVLEELDGLKQGEATDERAGTARRVIRSIQARNDLRYESADTGLLPSDWDAELADNLILSVVLRLRLSDVLLLTDDKNLRNKAKAEQITALGPEEYGASRPNAAPAGQKLSKPRRK